MAALPEQTQRFAVNYFVYTWRQQRSLDKDLGQQVARVLSAFSVWLTRMASTEATACAVLKRSAVAGQKLFEAEEKSGGDADFDSPGACPNCNRSRQSGAAIAHSDPDPPHWSTGGT